MDIIVLFILIGVVILLVILSFFNKGPKTVYLKPKGQETKEKLQPNNTEEINSTVDTVQDVNLSNPTPEDVSSGIQTSPTSAYADDSVIQSDLKNIRKIDNNNNNNVRKHNFSFKKKEFL